MRGESAAALLHTSLARRRSASRVDPRQDALREQARTGVTERQEAGSRTGLGYASL